jgi:hypothetical protein
LVLFPSFSRYITSWTISATWPVRRHLEVDATGRDRVYGWLLVGYHVSGVSRPGRVGHSDPQRPSTGSIGGPFHVQLGECFFVRWIGPLPLECTRDFLFENGCAWWCLFHSTKLLCMKCAIKKVLLI